MGPGASSVLIAAVAMAAIFVAASLIRQHLSNLRLERADAARNERERDLHEFVRGMRAHEAKRAEVIAGLICLAKCTAR